MNKRVIFGIMFVFFLILIISSVYAGWFGRLTGSAVNEEGDFSNASVSNSSCYDSDFGSYYEKGVRTYQGTESEDFCVSADLTEINPPVEEGPYVYEYYCEGEELFLCPFVCKEGACVNETNYTSKSFVCDDSDGGIVYNIRGSTVSSENESFLDVCVKGTPKNLTNISSENYLVEYYCGENSIKSVEHICENGCYAGACIENNSGNSSSNCSETDNSNDFFVKGITSCSQGVFEDSCLNEQGEFSKRGPYVLEYFCKGPEYFGNQTYTCENSCFDGACLKNNTTENYVFKKVQSNQSLGKNKLEYEKEQEKPSQEKTRNFWQRVENFFSKLFSRNSSSSEEYSFPEDCGILEGKRVFESEDLCYTGNSPVLSEDYVCEVKPCSAISSSGNIVLEPQEKECICKGKEKGGKCVTSCGETGSNLGCGGCICEIYEGAGAYVTYQCYEASSSAAKVKRDL